MVKLSSTFDQLSINQFREKFGQPETEPIRHVDGKPLPPNVLKQAVVPLYLGKKAQDSTLADAHGLVLSDFGEALAPIADQRLGEDCRTPMASKAPEALFEPDILLSYPLDIWSLGAAIWEILGMESICGESETFGESETEDGIVA